MDWKIIILFLIVTFNSYSQEDKELITFLYHNAEKIDIEDDDFTNIYQNGIFGVYICQK